MHRAAQRSLVALWFGILPALSAGLVLRYLVPLVGGGFAGGVSKLGRDFGVVLWVALFLLFSAIVRYWRYRLPGGRFASTLPVHLVPGERDPDRLSWWADCAALYEQMASARGRRRLVRRLDAKVLGTLDGHLLALREGLESGDARLVERARSAVESIAAPILARWRTRRAFDTAGAAAAAVCAVLVVRACVVEQYRVLSASMLPTLEPDDRIAGNRLAYAIALGGPRRGDLVVFRSSAVALGEELKSVPEVLVKRVIGLPGDRVSMRGSTPIINGWEVPRCNAGEYVYLLPDASGNALHGELLVEFLEDRAYLTVRSSAVPFPEPYLVKAGEVFVLGDNRGNSLDSRSYAKGSGGGVPYEAIQARAEWFLVGTHRSGDADLGRLFRPIDEPHVRLRLEGIDAEPLRSGISKCLQNRPAVTRPPPPGQANLASGLGMQR